MCETAVIIAHNGTLFIEKKGKQKLNKPLLNALKGAGIKYIFLYPPDEALKQVDIRNAKFQADDKLLKQLQKQGFEVEYIDTRVLPAKKKQPARKKSAAEEIMEDMERISFNVISNNKIALTKAQLAKIAKKSNKYSDAIIFESDTQHDWNISRKTFYYNRYHLPEAATDAECELNYAIHIHTHLCQALSCCSNINYSSVEIGTEFDERVSDMIDTTGQLTNSRKLVTNSDYHLMNMSLHQTKSVIMQPTKERLDNYEQLADKINGKKGLWSTLASLMYSITLGVVVSIAKGVASVAEAIERKVRKKPYKPKINSAELKKVRQKISAQAMIIAQELRSSRKPYEDPDMDDEFLTDGVYAGKFPETMS